MGLKSTALRFGAATPRWLVLFYTGAVVLWGAAGLLAGAHVAFAVALALAAAQMAWQVVTLDTSNARQLPRAIQIEPAGWLAAVRRPGRRHGDFRTVSAQASTVPHSGAHRLRYGQKKPMIGAVHPRAGMRTQWDLSKLWKNLRLRNRSA